MKKQQQQKIALGKYYFPQDVNFIRINQAHTFGLQIYFLTWFNLISWTLLWTSIWKNSCYLGKVFSAANHLENQYLPNRGQEGMFMQELKLTLKANTVNWKIDHNCMTKHKGNLRQLLSVLYYHHPYLKRKKMAWTLKCRNLNLLFWNPFINNKFIHTYTVY